MHFGNRNTDWFRCHEHGPCTFCIVCILCVRNYGFILCMGTFSVQSSGPCIHMNVNFGRIWGQRGLALRDDRA